MTTVSQPNPQPQQQSSGDGSAPGTQDILDAAGLAQESNNTKNTAAAVGSRVIAGANSSIDQLEPLAKVAQDSFNYSSTAMQDLNTQVTQSTNTINDAIEKKQQLQQMPFHQIIGPLADLLGAPDYSIAAQNRRIQDASTQIEAAGQKANAALKTAQVLQSASTFARENAMSGLMAARELSMVEGNNASTQVSLMAAQHQQKYNFLESLTPQQLLTLSRDPSMMQAKGIGAGDIQDVVTRKNESQLQMQSAGVMLHNAQLTGSREALELGSLAAEKGMSLMDGQKLADLRAQAQAAPDGRVMVDSGFKGPDGKPIMFPVSQQTIDQKLLERDAFFKQKAEQELKINEQVASLPGKLRSLGMSLPTLASDPAVSGVVTAAEATALTNQFTTAANLANGGIADKATASVMADQAQKMVADIVEKAKANLPEAKRAGMTEQYASGQMTTQSASDWLSSEIQNATPTLAHVDPLAKGWLGTNDPYASLDVGLRNAYQTAAASQASMLGGGDLRTGKGVNIADMTRFKLDPKGLFETKVLKSQQFAQAKADTDANLRNWYFSEAMKRLATDNVVNGANRPGLEAFKQFFDGGHVAQAYQMPGQYDKFDINKVIQTLHLNDKAANSQNVATLMGTLNDQGFRADMQQKDRSTYNSPFHAALRSRFYNNDISNVLIGSSGLLNRIRSAQSLADQQIKDALAQQAQQAATKTGGFQPTFGAGNK